MKRLKEIRRDDAGFALIEVLVSVVLLVIVSVGVFTAFDSGTRATAQERHRARANDLAEQDLERMRAMRITDLSTLNQTNTVTQDNTVYTIRSVAQFVQETATTSTCASGTGSRDYLNVTSTVTWPGMGSRPPVSASSIVSPPSGSVVPNSGSLLVQVDSSRSVGISGVTITGSGAGSFSGTTGSTGCVLWRNLPAGNYSMNFSGVASGKVDPDGNPPSAQTVSVVAQSTNTVEVQFDNPGSITNITFQTRDYNNNLITTSADSVIAFNSGMTTADRFGTPGTPVNSLSATGLFPFTSPYSVYAGLCSNNDPGAGVGQAVVTVPVGGSASPTAPVQLPSLQLYVLSGNSSSSVGSVVSGSVVKVEDMDCNDIPTTNFRRTYTTNASGQLPNPGLPYSTYQACASANISGIQRRNYARTSSGAIENIPVQNLAAGTLRGIFLGTSAPGVTTGSSAVCP